MNAIQIDAMSESQAKAALLVACNALREIQTICNESVGDCRRRMGTRWGNSSVAVDAAIKQIAALTSPAGR